MQLKGKGLTAIIISCGLETLLRYCLENLRRELSGMDPCGAHCIVVVDNATPFPYNPADYQLPELHLIRLDSRAGFSRACNLAARAQPNEYYLLLNNDVLLAEGTVYAMLSVLHDDPQTGICGSRLLFPDRSIQHCGVVFGGGERGPYHCFRRRPAHLVPRRRQSFQAVTGACLLVRRQVWDLLGGLDEAYDFGLEDIDFCLRARQQGWKVVCVNDTDSLHFEAMTPGRVERDVPSRQLFMDRWQGRYCLDG